MPVNNFLKKYKHPKSYCRRHLEDIYYNPSYWWKFCKFTIYCSSFWNSLSLWRLLRTENIINQSSGNHPLSFSLIDIGCRWRNFCILFILISWVKLLLTLIKFLKRNHAILSVVWKCRKVVRRYEPIPLSSAALRLVMDDRLRKRLLTDLLRRDLSKISIFKLVHTHVKCLIQMRNCSIIL